MSAQTNYRELSRRGWVGSTTVESINAGSLQRIADAVEKVAANYDALLRSKKFAEEGRDYWKAREEKACRSRRALRGRVTRLQRELLEARASLKTSGRAP